MADEKTLRFIPGYREWREKFDTEKVYSQREMADELHRLRLKFERSSRIMGVVRILPNEDQHMMILHHIDRTEEGIFVYVR